MEVDSAGVLVVDDDARCRRAMARALREGGHRTVEAANAEEALARAARQPPALAVSEILLPVTSGYEVCRTLKDRYGPDLPVILVSDRRSHPADRAAALMIGADDFVAKPVHPEELRARVRRRLERPGAQRAAGAARLTPRELEVMALLAEGLAAAEIADRLVITERTVAKHLEHILAKLGARNRAQAVAVALRGDVLGAGRR